MPRMILCPTASMCLFADPSEDWGASVLAEALYTASNDVTRVQSLLPELSPADRCSKHQSYSRRSCAPPLGCIYK